MLPTPSWSRLKKWRLKRAADRNHQRDQQNINQESKSENPSHHHCAITTTNYQVGGGQRSTSQKPSTEPEPEVSESKVKQSLGCDSQQQQQQRRRLGALIPRTLSTLLSRATSPLRKSRPTTRATHPPEVALDVGGELTEVAKRPPASQMPSQRCQEEPATGSAQGHQDKTWQCHLTAKTRDNQCAVHGGVNSTSPLQHQQDNNGQQSLKERLRRGSGGGGARTAKVRPSPRDKAKSVPTWPLAKQTLDNNLAYELRLGHFGDCEDLLSAHLAGRLFGALTARTDQVDQCYESFSDAAELTACELRLADQLRAFNYNHKRPFGATYEWPSTGWLYGATGMPPTHAGSVASLKAKLFASTGYRRRSYDDQEGDNDYQIILQPADIEQMERKAKAKFAHYKATTTSCSQVAAAHSTNNNNINCEENKLVIIEAKTQVNLRRSHRRQTIRTKLETLTNLFEDMKLAKCLLDQDYNHTVQLFVAKSALNWNFNAFTFDALCCGRSLTHLLMHLFDFYNLHKVFQLDILKVLKCFRLLEFGYHSTNPYHNSVHAADVTQAMHCFIQEHRIRQHLTHLEILSSILAAVCHDLDHPGVNQSFLIATGNPLAQLYNKTSVLENHHWRFALCIFKEARLFDHFEPQMLADMQDQLKQLILATDIARQNDYLKRFKELTTTTTTTTNEANHQPYEHQNNHRLHQQQPKRTFSMTNAQDRALVLQMALKCADLGNPCRPWLISRVWSNLICEEFYRMGSIERRLNLPLTPICQRHKTSIAGIQTDFFKFIVLPLLELWHGFLGSPLSRLLMSNFEHNYKRWQRANRIVGQLRRRKSVACLATDSSLSSPPSSSTTCFSMPDNTDRDDENTRPRQDRSSSLFNDPDDDPIIEQIYTGRAFKAIKRASSDYVKSGNRQLELLRDFQLSRTIEKSPRIARRRAHRANNHSNNNNSTKKTSDEVSEAAANQICAHLAPVLQPKQNCHQQKARPISGVVIGHQQVTAAAAAAAAANDQLTAIYRHTTLSPIQDGDWSSATGTFK